MKKFLSLGLVLFVLAAFPQCKKDGGACKPRSVSSETATMQSFAVSKGITPTVHSSGLLYQKISDGTAPLVSINSTIFIKYTGTFLDGRKFDEQQDASQTGFSLNNLIEGWRIGIPLVGKGGHIKLIVPSSMGYGCEDYGVIPGNSILYFDIEVVDVK